VSPVAESQSAAGAKADLRRSLSLCVAEGLVAMPLVTMSLPVNLFLTALVVRGFPLSTPVIGLFCALPFVGNFIQIFAVPLLARWQPPKTQTVLFELLHLLSWVGLALLLPMLPRQRPAAAGAGLLAWFLVSSCFSAMAGVNWNSWIEDWVPARLRGKFFGRRNRLLQFSALAFLLVVGWVLGGWDYSVPAFQAIIAGAVLLRCFSIRWQWISPTRAARPSRPAALSLRHQLGILRRSGSLLIFVAFGCVWAFATYCFGPFYQVFMFEQTHFTAFEVGVTATLSQLGGALSLPAWGQLLDRYGNKPVMVFSLFLWQVPNFFWCFITPGNSVLLYPLWTWAGATSAGFVLGQFTILLRLIPTEAKNLAIGFNLAVTSLFAAVAPVAGGWILQRGMSRFGDALAVYHGCFLLQPVLVLAGAFLLLRVHEPAAQPFGTLVGAMRNVRTLGGVLGLSFLTNYVFVRPPHKDRGMS
jgi:hypothetical protein